MNGWKKTHVGTNYLIDCEEGKQSLYLRIHNWKDKYKPTFAEISSSDDPELIDIYQQIDYETHLRVTALNLENTDLFTIENKPYKNYERIEFYIYRRDKFTCQHCGYSTNKVISETYGCALLPHWFDRLALFNRHPTFCPALDELGFKRLQNFFSSSIINGVLIPHNKIPIKPCNECDYFALYFIEDFEKGKLLVHHKNNDPCDNRLDNLITLCRSCNNLNQYKRSKHESTNHC